MWNETDATRLLKIAYPIVQGPFGGGLSSVELAATVSNLGGLGRSEPISSAPVKSGIS
jgi:nitronate monooxygenase